MKFKECVNRLYYEETIHELAVRNQTVKNSLSYNSILYIDTITYIPNCTVSVLAERLHISKSAVTMKVNELIRQGYIEKEQSCEDRRVFYLRPRKCGEELFPEYNAALHVSETYLNEKYTEDEMKIFEQILNDATEKYIEELKSNE